jgi:CheY-like chemotaxis protein
METIVLVDDEPAVLQLCQTILKRGGYRVLSASGPEEALMLLENANSSDSIDLALLDVMMPVMNGVELARRIQSAHPNIKVVLMTGFAANEIHAVTGDSCPYRIIWKPFKTESLLQMIENALQDSESASSF